jgi:PII-like signaling protein
MSEYTEVERVRVYCGETDRHDGRPIYELLVEEARKQGAAGSTVLRGVLGFGADSLIHTSKILRLSEDLPMIVEIVDRPERISAILPHLEPLVSRGLITRERLTARFHCPILVRDVMAVDVATVGPDAPLPEVVRLLLTRGVKAVPVVAADGAVLGLITGGDLLARGGMHTRLSLQERLPAEEQEGELSRLAGQTARDVMTSPAVTVRARTRLPAAAKRMSKKGLTRLPVLSGRAPPPRLLGACRGTTSAAAADGGARRPPESLPPLYGRPCPSRPGRIFKAVPTGPAQRST